MVLTNSNEIKCNWFRKLKGNKIKLKIILRVKLMY